MVRKILLLCLMAGLIVVSGCTQTPPEQPGQGITPSPAIIRTTETADVPTPVPETTMIPTTLIAAVNATPAPEADPAEVSEIRFTQYIDSDFSMDYPSAWNVSKTTYTSYNCISIETARCYQNEIKTIGPFNFNDVSSLKKPSRIVTFTSADGRQKIVAFTSDFLDGLNGVYAINPVLEWAKNRVTANYPDVAGSAVGDYQYARMGGNSNIMTVSYSVTMPAGSAAYPLAYSTKNFITMHHVYEFAFISDTENIQKYRYLKDRIFSSITPYDTS